MNNKLNILSGTRLRELWNDFDKGFLLVLVICLFAAWPFLSRPSLPQETDAELHIFRLAELSRMVRGGEPYPRWASNFYYGYGYPIFNYYAPLTYYLGLGVELLPRLDAVDGVKILFILGLVGAGVGMYGFVRDKWGRTAGIVAGAAYVFAPYVQFVDPHARGDLAEAFSFGVFSMTLWSLSRLYDRPDRWRWIWAACLTGAVILTHNLMALVFFGLLLGWVIWLVSSEWMGKRSVVKNQKKYILLFGALLSGVGLAAIFWMPVALEQSAVNLSSLIGDGSHFDFRNHFLLIQELLAMPKRLDWGATEPDFRLNLGVAQWVLGAIGLLGLLVAKKETRRQAGYFGLMLAGLVFLMLPESTLIWEKVPFLPYLQFPWRFLGATAAMTAVLAGLAFVTVMRLFPKKWRPYIGAIMTGVILVLGLPNLEVPPWADDFGPTDVRRVVNIELAGRWLGTTSTADFVPATVELLPKPEGSVLQSLFDNETPDRVNRATLPAGTEVVFEEVTPLHFRYHSNSEKEYLLRLFLFNFPGWEAKLDNETIAIQLARPEGFIIVPVPSGEHVIDIYFGNTPVRLLAAIISGLTLILVFGVSLRLRLSTTGPTQNALLIEGDENGLAAILVGVVVIIGVYLMILNPMGLLRYESANYVPEPADHHVIENFGDQIALIGYDIPEQIKPGREFDLTLYWQPWQPLSINYQGFVHLLAEDGSVVAQSDKLNPGDFPTNRWPQDKYVRDEYQLNIPAQLPSGSYKLSVGLWVASEGWRLPLLNDDRTQIGDNFIIQEYRLEVR